MTSLWTRLSSLPADERQAGPSLVSLWAEWSWGRRAELEAHVPPPLPRPWHKRENEGQGRGDSTVFGATQTGHLGTSVLWVPGRVWRISLCWVPRGLGVSLSPKGL